MRWVSTLHLQFPFAYFKYAYTRLSYHYHQGDDCDSNAVALTPQQKSYVSSLALVDNIVSGVRIDEMHLCLRRHKARLFANP